MVFINYIHKIQSIDKCLPLIISLKNQCQDLRVLTIIDLEPTALHEIPADLLDTLHKVSSKTVISPYSGAQELNINLRFVGSIIEWIIDFLIKVKYSSIYRSEDLLSEKSKSVLLCTNSIRNRRLGRYLVRFSKSNRIPIITYLKSVNDRGRGLSVDGKAKKLYRLPYDMLLIPNQKFSDILTDSGYPDEKFLIVGHPPFYKCWRLYIEKQKLVSDLKQEGSPRFVIFSRGPAPHKSDEDQIITDKLEKKLLNDIIDAIQSMVPNAIVWIKPHPYQKINNIDRICQTKRNVSIKKYSVHTLAAAADIAISMYSSSSLDVLTYDKPSIEYFIETPGFRKAHPAGSTFSDYGVIPCRSVEELKNSIQQSLVGNKNVSNSIYRIFGHVDNYQEIIKYLKNKQLNN